MDLQPVTAYEFTLSRIFCTWPCVLNAVFCLVLSLSVSILLLIYIMYSICYARSVSLTVETHLLQPAA